MRSTCLALVVMATLCGAAAAQNAPRERRDGHRPPANLSQDERRQIREDVDSVRPHYGQRAGPRPERMGPRNPETLRRDVQDANRAMKKR